MGNAFQVLLYFARLSRELRLSRGKLVFMAVSGVVSGLASTALVALIVKTLSRGGPNPSGALAWIFAALCLALPLFRMVSQMVLIGLSQKASLDLRLRLSQRILEAPLRQLESLGQHRLLAALTNDIEVIVNALLILPTLFVQLTILLSCLAYLGYLSGVVLGEIVVVMVVGVVTSQLLARRGERYLARARRSIDQVTGHIRALTEGTKELKMHRARRLGFLDALGDTSTALQGEMRTGFGIFAIASSWAEALFFAVVGFVVLVVPRIHTVESQTLVGYVIILFQIMAPLEIVLSVLPSLSRAVVSVRTIEELGVSLVSGRREPDLAGAAPPSPAWERLELVGITHTYRRDQGDEIFELGPVDLSFAPGELVFLVGGNGSGKTTLAKLILGLYIPEQGEVRLDGQAVDDALRVSYRERFTAVFADFFAFDTLLGLDAASLDDDARRYLRDLHLEHKVKVEDGQLSTVELSQGQRKRLALLAAYLEDRPIYLLDEWAADQDPYFKEIFYLQMLPELKRRGKTVFVISHDDRYFHVADRVIKLEDGQIELDLPIAEFLAKPAGAPIGAPGIGRVAQSKGA